MKNEQSQQNHDLMHYVGMLFRQKAWLFGVMLLTMLLGSLLIYLIPKVYSAQSSILIEQETLYISGEDRNNEQGLTHRVQAIFKTILTNDSIESILKKFNLIDDNASKIELHEAFNSFRKSVNLNFENAMVVNPYTGREGMASLGFLVRYEGNSPELTYEITNELTNLLFSANKGKISNKQASQLQFLVESKKVALSEVMQVESKLAEYKEANSSLLPEIQTIIIQRMDDLKSELKEVESQIEQLRHKEDEILATIATTREDEGLYSSDGTRITGNVEKLIILELEFEELSSKYTSNHPSMIAMEEDIATLKKRIKSAEKKQSSGLGRPVNPVLELLRTRLSSTKKEVEYKFTRIARINEEIKSSYRQLKKMPSVGKELQLLELEQQGMVKKYEEIEAKLVQANLSADMNDANLLDNFILLEPPQYPLKPIKPRKKILLAVLFILSVSLGILVALLKEIFNNKISSREGLAKYVDASVYMIPMMKPKTRFKKA